MWTNDYIRIPFKEHGYTRAGANCYGLVQIIYAEQLGIELPIISGYSNTKDNVKISEMIKAEAMTWDFIKPGDEKAFDIAVFRILGRPTHVAVVVEPGLMIHSERGSGVYLTQYHKENQWDRRLEGFFRYAKRADGAVTVPPSPANGSNP
jgi:cell wall-associated NlpC family hydrolase